MAPGIEGCITRLADDGVLLVTLNHRQNTNPINEDIRRALIEACQFAEQDDATRALVITGGISRSFSAGGDFREVQKLRGGDDVAAWIKGVVELYTTVLSVTKPTVAAIGGHAIGIGFQLALSCDWRVGADDCSFSMPELRHGIACTLGSHMLELAFGRLSMMDIVLGAQPISAQRAHALRLLNQVVPEEQLIRAGVSAARELASYPALTYRRTKAFMNHKAIAGLNAIVDDSSRIHSDAFRAGTAQRHFDNILHRSRAQASQELKLENSP